MRALLAMARREALGVLLSPAVWVAGAFFVLLDAFAFYLALAPSGPALAVFDNVALFMVFTSALLCPVISMRAFSEERALGTLETLFTAPVGRLCAVLAKYAGCLAFAGVWLLHGAVFAVLMAQGGQLDAASAAAALGAVGCVCALAMAVGVFVSALTASAAAAAAGTTALVVLLAAAGTLDPWSGQLQSFVSLAGFMPHVRRMAAGCLATDAAVYFVSTIALFLFGAWAVLCRPAGRPRRTLIAACAAAVVIWCNVNWLAVYPFATFEGVPGLGWLSVLRCREADVSDDGRNTLLPRTRRALDNLQSPLFVYCFFDDQTLARGIDVAEPTRELTARLARASALVRPVFVNARTDPGRAAYLSTMLGYEGNPVRRVVVDYQGRRRLILADGLVVAPDAEAQLAGRSDWQYDGENMLGSVIADLQDPRVTNVFFTSGHGELAPEGSPRQDQSVAGFASALLGMGMQVRGCTLANGSAVPADCDMLVIAAPRAPWSAADAKSVQAYLDAGGRVLYIAPAAGELHAGKGDALSDMLFGLGGTYRDDVLQDEEDNSDNNPLLPIGRPRGIPRGSQRTGRPFVFPVTRTIKDNPNAIMGGWLCERVILSGPSSAATDMEGSGRRKGPFTLLYRTMRENSPARLVFCASGRLASDQGLEMGANEALLVMMTQWLTGREEALSDSRRFRPDRALHMNPVLLERVLLVGTAGLPLLWLLMGALVWRLRRQ